ncbi:DUF7302 family protein [Rhizobium phaseoli]|uniref:Uncharacterized protein n=1 Tax=Rhizobium phaseoli TaxID=396 RepID=A0ABN4QJT1_9HYPH|nr:hypothetical protein [Rhizobium phaseoli]ANL84677.1 hypothetical protein AMC81_CH01896 [Rhizobium phaseoli]ANL91184.1 hypothetical protein AMC80_CH01896 [Rhizobium phaseoli]
MIVRVIPAYDFDGYPDGINKRSFQAGVEASVPDHYAELLIAKKAAVRAKKQKSPDSEQRARSAVAGVGLATAPPSRQKDSPICRLMDSYRSTAP